MKVIIAGGRKIIDYSLVEKAVKESGFDITEVVSGKARGVDLLGETWAVHHNLPVKLFPADWTKYRNGAGPIRNKQMAEYADALIVVWDGKSSGTADMIENAKKRGLKVYIERV